MNIEKWDSVLSDYQSCIRMFTWHNLKIMSTMPLGVTLSFYLALGFHQSCTVQKIIRER